MTEMLIRALAAEPWAIQPDWLHAIWAISIRQPRLSDNTGEDWTERDVQAAVGPGAPYYAFRRRLARSILLGLEFLIAADIIRTVAVQPTIENLAVLDIIVLIRTFFSFSLEVESEGRWPWQRSRPGEPERTV